VHYYRLTIQYKGTRYLGWQIQPDGHTVQGELNKALKIIAKSDSIRSLGSGRTDAGVHALGQVVKVGLPIALPPDVMVRAINGNLPDDIRVISGELSDEAFMPTVHARSKEYHYRFTNERTFTAFQGDFIPNHHFELDFKTMQEACKLLVGEHDFLNYFTEGTDVNSTVRTIFECEILEVPAAAMLPAHHTFRIVGSGFLKQMVRLLMGTLWNIGRGKVSLEEFKASLGSTKTQRLGAVAPPQGLYLVRVNY
jgi:tRNA pseudouridine38-40 synthase